MILKTIKKLFRDRYIFLIFIIFIISILTAFIAGVYKDIKNGEIFYPVNIYIKYNDANDHNLIEVYGKDYKKGYFKVFDKFHSNIWKIRKKGLTSLYIRIPKGFLNEITLLKIEIADKTFNITDNIKNFKHIYSPFFEKDNNKVILKFPSYIKYNKKIFLKKDNYLINYPSFIHVLYPIFFNPLLAIFFIIIVILLFYPINFSLKLSNILISSIFLIITGIFILTGFGPTHDSVQWSGIFHYFYSSVEKGVFPLWNPYSQTGTPFYPYYQAQGLLVPTTFVFILIEKITNCSTWTTYIMNYMFMYYIFILGSFYTFRYLSKNNKTSFLFSLTLLASTFPIFMRTWGAYIYTFFGFITYFLLKFLTEEKYSKKGFYFIITSYLISLSLNIYIPSIIMFYFVLILFFLILLKKANLKYQLEFLFIKEKKYFIISIIFSLLIISPLLILFFNNNELFPSLRILIYNINHIIKAFASDINGTMINESFTNMKKTSITIGNILGLLLEPVRFFPEYSEVILYAGLLPFILIIYSFFKLKDHKKSYLYVFLLLSFFTMMIMSSFSTKILAPLSFNQRLLNNILIFLKPTEILQNFGGLFLFSILTVSIILYNKFSQHFYKKIFFIYLFLFIFKYLIIFKLELFKIFYYKLIIFSLFILFIIFIIFKSSKHYKFKNYYKNLCLLLLISDVFIWFNYQYYIHFKFISKRRYYVLTKMENIFNSRLNINKFDTHKKITSYTKNLYSISFYGHEIYKNSKVTYPVVITKDLIPYLIPYLDHFYTTKYYYDLLTNIDIEKQPFLNGISNPVIDFFPLKNVNFVKNKYECVNKINNSNIKTLKNNIFIEKNIEYSKNRVYAKEFFNKNNFIKYSENETMKFIKNCKDKYNTKLNYKILNYDINNIELKVNIYKKGYLYYANGYSKDWKCYIDNKETKIEKANINFKAVLVKKGEHIIRFSYLPMFKYSIIFYFIGNIIFIISLMILKRNL